jgi:hypothetical protein
MGALRNKTLFLLHDAPAAVPITAHLQTFFSGDGKKPRPHRGLLPEPGHGLVRIQKNILRHFFCLGNITEHVTAKSNDGVLVRLHERFQGTPVIAIGEVILHGIVMAPQSVPIHLGGSLKQPNASANVCLLKSYTSWLQPGKKITQLERFSRARELPGRRSKRQSKPIDQYP